jgi:exosome complex RNA-binding protein Csl4
MSERGKSVEHARKFLGLIDDQGYALCSRCRSRLEDEGKLYCFSCDEIIRQERAAGVFKK